MFINKLRLYNFRSTIEQEYIFKNNVNIFYGDNGVGKTSILEAIHFLSSGKSFRKGSFKNIINFNKEEITVYLECFLNDSNNVFSVNKHKSGKWNGKINQTKVYKQVEITNLLPVISIDPEVYRLVDFGPLYRRNYLDWLVFHVKHEYITLWKKVYKCIKQLNHLYKSKADVEEIMFWENSFVNYSEKLNAKRLEAFNGVRSNILKSSLYMQEEIPDLNLVYKKGWSNEFTLKEQLEKDRIKNILYGQLQHGPHKMDIKIQTGKYQASQTLSRGQKKILSIAFYMAYIEYLNKHNINPVLCLDDFDAEIDENKLIKAASFFNTTKTQIFITSVQKEKIQKAFPEADLFHVKH